MRSSRWRLVAAIALLAIGTAACAATGPVVTAEIRGGIGPPTAAYFQRVLDHARSVEAALVVVSLDTPGGLDTSMREIIQATLASPTPVAIYVAPSGARAASAGLYILYAAHVAAMAPGTNTGAATPIAIRIGGDRGDEGKKKPASEGEKPRAGDASEDKAIRDAVAYLRSLAELRGRNARWVEKAVVDADSLSATEALKEGVVDVVARDVSDLLAQLQGRKIRMADGERSLDVAGAALSPVAPNWKEGLLAIIANPNVALLLMLAGVYGLLFEFYMPGTALPGVLGGIALVLGLYGLAMLPVTVAGVALVLLGCALMVGEAFVQSFGVLGIGGIAAFVLGVVLLVDAEVPGFTISWTLIGPIVVANAAILGLIGALAMRSRRRPVVSGGEAIIGATAVALEDFDREGWVRMAGERWRARSRTPVALGARLRVVGRDGLTLTVEGVNEGTAR
jgi:membrane-bound serine protease (ClpP class)